MLLHVVDDDLPLEFLFEAKCSDLVQETLPKLVDYFNLVVQLRHLCHLVSKLDQLPEELQALLPTCKKVASAETVGEGTIAAPDLCKKLVEEVKERYEKVVSGEAESAALNASSPRLLEPTDANIWCANKKFDPTKPFSARIGKNEKTRIKVRLRQAIDNESKPKSSSTEATQPQILSNYLKKRKAEEYIEKRDVREIARPRQGGDDEEFEVDPMALEKLRHRKDIVQALKSPLLQERLAAINKEPSSFILQQNLDRDSDLREFLSTCLEAVGALKSVKDEAGDKKYEFDGTGIVKKKSHD